MNRDNDYYYLHGVDDDDVEGAARNLLPRPLDVDEVVSDLRGVVDALDDSLRLLAPLHLNTERTCTARNDGVSRSRTAFKIFVR